ncbi:hypothetical protein LXL04_003237 [Taraxacum kok-saghyz]
MNEMHEGDGEDYLPERSRTSRQKIHQLLAGKILGSPALFLYTRAQYEPYSLLDIVRFGIQQHKATVEKIPSMEHTAVKEAIQAQSQLASSVQSTVGKEPIQAQSQSHSLVQSTGRLKRKKASAYEKGRKKPICIFCHRVISVHGKSSENATSKVCFTIPEEEEVEDIPEEEEVEEEIPLRNVKAQTAKDDLVGHIHEDDLTPREKGLLRSVKEADLLVEGLFSHIHEDDLTPSEKGMLKSVKEDLRDVFHFLSTFVGTKNLKMIP